MVLSQLLQPKLSFRINRNGFSKPKRRLSPLHSDTVRNKPSQLKKTVMPKEQRAEAVESFVKMYMKKNPGVFPKASHIQNEVGGSWYTVKEILHNVKEKMLGTNQPGNQHNVKASTPAEDSAASNIEPNNQPGPGVHADLVVHCLSKDENIEHAAAIVLGDSSSSLVVGTMASEVTNMQDNSSSCELEAALLVLTEKPASNSHTSEKKTSANLALLRSGDCSEGTAELNAVSGQQKSKDFCSLLPSTSHSPSHGNLKGFVGLADLFKMKHEVVVEANKGRRMQSEVAESGVFGFETGRNSRANELSLSGIVSPRKSPSMLEDAGLKSVSIGTKKHPLVDDMIRSSETPNVMSKVGEPFLDANKIIQLKDTKTMNNKSSEMSVKIKRDKLMKRYFGHTEEHKEKDGSKSFAIKGLINCIKELPPPRPIVTVSQESIPSSKTSKRSMNRRLGGSQSVSNFRSFDEKGRKNSSKGHPVHGKCEDDASVETLPAKLKIEDDYASSQELAVPDCSKANGSTQVPFLTNKKYPMDIHDNFFEMEESHENKMVVKFLKKATQESHLVDAFKNCGDILKVEIPYVEGAHFQNAYIYFKTREGLRKALGNTDLLVRGVNVSLEAAGSIKDASKRISIPSLVGDPNIPASLVKNPTRTVMIEPLTHDISSRHIEAALAFCGSNVTGFFFGSSNSVAYVEFATEEGKQKALAKHSIDVLGKKLLIYRIDVPRTTVVRILHNPSLNLGKIIKFCSSLGKFRAITPRCEGILDVQFGLPEWPNMVKILNRLNGIPIDGQPLIAEPASIFPPNILCALWDQPEEREYIKATAHKLFQKLGESADHTVEFTHLVDKLYRDQ